MDGNLFIIFYIAKVFYSDKARAKWGRENKPGKLYVRDVKSDATIHHNRRKLLTSLGHPNVFNDMNS